MILPFLLLLLGALYLARQHDRGAPAVPPLTVDPEASVAALRGELAGARGDWLIATLVPLHNDPSRQAFEAAALSRRLELGPGEPWRLSVRWSVPESARGSDSSGTRAARGSEAIAQVAPQGIALGRVEVRDTGGPALSSIPGAASAAGASDPLRVLCAPPPGALQAGQTADWILWGRAPAEDPRLVGLVPADDEAFRSATGFSGELVLRATHLRRGDLQQPLARLERGLGELEGKIESSRASQGPPGDDDEL